MTRQTSSQRGTWCSGITPAQHAGGPGFNPQRVHFFPFNNYPRFVVPCGHGFVSMSVRVHVFAPSLRNCQVLVSVPHFALLVFPQLFCSNCHRAFLFNTLSFTALRVMFNVLFVSMWPRGVTVSTLDSESSVRGSNPREAFLLLVHHVCI